MRRFQPVSRLQRQDCKSKRVFSFYLPYMVCRIVEHVVCTAGEDIKGSALAGVWRREDSVRTANKSSRLPKATPVFPCNESAMGAVTSDHPHMT